MDTPTQHQQRKARNVELKTSGLKAYTQFFGIARRAIWDGHCPIEFPSAREALRCRQSFYAFRKRAHALYNKSNQDFQMLASPFITSEAYDLISCIVHPSGDPARTPTNWNSSPSTLAQPHTAFFYDTYHPLHITQDKLIGLQYSEETPVTVHLDIFNYNDDYAEYTADELYEHYEAFST